MIKINKWKIIAFIFILLFSIYKIIDNKNLNIKDNIYIVSQSKKKKKETISNNISDEKYNSVKEDIKIEIQDGYLIVHAKANKAETDKEEGKYVRKERYYGECSRSFYVGEDVTEEDIKAKFKNGTLTLEVNKKDEPKQLPDKKYIDIE